MNKFKVFLLSFLGGMNVFITVTTPIMLVLVYLSIFGIKGHWSSYILLTMGWGASLFRAIKFWIKEE